MKVLKSMMLGAFLAAPMVAGAVTTTSFSGVNESGNTADIAGFTGGNATTLTFNPSNSEGSNNATGSYSTSIGQTRGATVTMSNEFPFTDTWSIVVGAGEKAKLDIINSTGGSSINSFATAAYSNSSLTTLIPAFDYANIIGNGTTQYWFKVTGFSGNNDKYSVTTAVSAVPVPAAAWLLGSGLVGLVSYRKRKSAIAA